MGLSSLSCCLNKMGRSTESIPAHQTPWLSYSYALSNPHHAEIMRNMAIVFDERSTTSSSESSTSEESGEEELSEPVWTR